MSDRSDEVTTALTERAPRRTALLGLGALGLGSLGLLGRGEDAAADNKCNRCKRKCRNKNGRKDNSKHCNNKCRNKCHNNN